MPESFPDDSMLQTVVVPRTRDLGDNFQVRRALPSAERRMVGPFVFLDQMGPTVFAAGRGLDVRPHPHIGLATVTYLMQGEILHRDSLGTQQAIKPGEVNWMTAGRGIVHSERTDPALRSHENLLAGLQCWVALPARHEETDPAFSHHGAHELPVLEGEGARAVIIAGSFFGQRSKVPTLSDLFYVDLQLQAGARMTIPAEYGEQALYVVQGKIALERDGEFEPGRLLVTKPGAVLTLRAVDGPARVMLLGGEPMEGPRFLTWNFVSSSAERIEQAKEDWQQQRFAKVPGDDKEFIPLPELPGRPVSYP